jgi:F-type H+-transporting ATPase subunit epsilon
MQLDILTPDKKVFSGEVSSVIVPGSKGSFEVLNNHAAIISTLDKGNIRYKSKDTEHSLSISGGVIEVLSNKVVVLVEAVL